MVPGKSFFAAIGIRLAGSDYAFQVFHDWSHALAHQGTYSIHPSQNHTSLPANIDDADLVEADVIQSKPLNVHTVSDNAILKNITN